MFKIMEHWLPPLGEEVPRELLQEEAGGSSGGEEEEEEAIKEEREPPLAVRKTRGQKHRETKASISLGEGDSDLEVAVEVSSKQAPTPSKPTGGPKASPKQQRQTSL